MAAIEQMRGALMSAGTVDLGEEVEADCLGSCNHFYFE